MEEEKNDFPAQWALEEAARRVGYGNWAIFLALHGPTRPVARIAATELARMIEKHEQPPVDPDVLAVRKILAAYEIRYHPELAQEILNGERDQHCIFQASLEAYREVKDVQP